MARFDMNMTDDESEDEVEVDDEEEVVVGVAEDEPDPMAEGSDDKVEAEANSGLGSEPEELTPGDTVWARAPGHPWWPARVATLGDETTYIIVRFLPLSRGKLRGGVRIERAKGALLAFTMQPQLMDSHKVIRTGKGLSSRRKQYAAAIAVALDPPSADELGEYAAMQQREAEEGRQEEAKRAREAKRLEQAEARAAAAVASAPGGSATPSAPADGTSCALVPFKPVGGKRPREEKTGAAAEKKPNEWAPPPAMRVSKEDKEGHPACIDGHAELIDVWKAVIEAQKDVHVENSPESVCRVVHGWTIEASRKWGRNEMAVTGPGWARKSTSMLCATGRAIRSVTALRDVLSLRATAASNGGVEWQPPAVGDLVHVHIQDETMASDDFEWRLAAVLKVDPTRANRFQVCGRCIQIRSCLCCLPLLLPLLPASAATSAEPPAPSCS